MAAKSRSLEEIKSDIALRAGRINPFERVDRKEVDGLLERLTSLDPGFRICRAASGQAWRMSRSQCRRARKTWQKRSGGKLTTKPTNTIASAGIPYRAVRQKWTATKPKRSREDSDRVAALW